MPRELEGIAQRLQEAADQALACIAGECGKGGAERKGSRRQLGALFTASTQRGGEALRQGDRKKRRGDIRPVADILEQRVGASTNEADGVYFEQEGGGCLRGSRLRVEHAGGAKGQLARVGESGGLSGSREGEKHCCCKSIICLWEWDSEVIILLW